MAIATTLLLLGMFLVFKFPWRAYRGYIHVTTMFFMKWELGLKPINWMYIAIIRPGLP